MKKERKGEQDEGTQKMREYSVGYVFLLLSATKMYERYTVCN